MPEPAEPPRPPQPRGGAELATLRASLAVAERRAATLAELTALMSEGRNPLALAQRAVELTARATRAAGAYVYLWERDQDRLVLRVATEGWQRQHLGRITLRMGEGLTGWSALMRQTVVVPREPTEDPRFKPFPELRESAFKSMIAVPIVAPGEEVLGVFSLYSQTEDAFSPTDVSLATEVGSLLASGLVQAETLSQLRVQSAAARFLCDLPDQAWGSIDQSLTTMADQCAIHLDADICVIELNVNRDRGHGGSTVLRIAERFREQNGIEGQTIDKAQLARVLAEHDLHRIRIPLGSAAPVGAVTCYRDGRFAPEDELLLDAVGAQIAAGVMSLFGTERVWPLFDQLTSSPDSTTTEQLLRRQGWKARTTWVAILHASSHTAKELADLEDERVKAAVLDAFGGGQDRLKLIGANGRYVVLVEPSALHSAESLVEQLRDLARRPGLKVTAGVGPVASTPQETYRAISHAVASAAWADIAATPEQSVVRYEDVAHLRLLPRTALESTASIRTLLETMAPLVRYDLENGADLARTLDSLLANGGSVAKTAADLFIHRNTLRQRIQRIEELVGISPENLPDAVTAGLAARLLRLSETDLERQPATRGSSRCPNGVVSVGRACCGLTSACVFSTPSAAEPA